jgi:transcriptional regulator
MYIPKANEETRLPVLQAMMRAHPLAAVVTMGAEGMVASHIPLVYEETGGEFGVLKGHVSRANSQWKDVGDGLEALAIFSGPQHYISAGWYPGKTDDGKEVPTWNYVVVHAYGRLRVVEDADWMLAHLTSLTDTHEAGSAVPWKVSDAPVEFIATMMKGIVGFELPIRRLEGKWKVSQNRNERDRTAVADALEGIGSAESLTMKGLVEGGRRG